MNKLIEQIKQWHYDFNLLSQTEYLILYLGKYILKQIGEKI